MSYYSCSFYEEKAKDESRYMGGATSAISLFFIVIGLCLFFTGLGFLYTGINPDISRAEIDKTLHDMEFGPPTVEVYSRIRNK